MPDFLTSTSAAIQAYTVPAGWNAAANKVEAVGPGGNGSARQNSSTAGRGAGAGSYAARSNLNLAIGDVIYYRLPAGGAAVDAWFNDLNLLQATNNNIGTSPWFLENTTATQSQSDPLGGSVATALRETAATTTFSVLQDGTGNPAGLTKPASTAIVLTWECHVMAVGGRNLQVTLYDSSGSNGAGANIDLSNGTLNGSAFTFGSGWSGATVVSITNPTGSWYRIVFQASVNNAATTFAWQARILDGSFTSSYAGSTSNGLNLYGATCTFGTKVKGFTATTTSPAFSVLAKCGTNATTGANGAGQSGSQGATVQQGGNGANQSGGVGGGGGGGGGPNGAGGNASTTTGGSADNGTVAGASAGNNGNSGTEFDATHGCGSGAGGSSAGNGKTGGAYGGGGSGADNDSAGNTGGIGGQALIVITLDTSGGGAQPSRLLLLGVG